MSVSAPATGDGRGQYMTMNALMRKAVGDPEAEAIAGERL